MRQRYWYRDGRMVDRDGMPMLNQYELAGDPCAPMVIRDTPEYISPVTGKPIDGRAARREDLRRHNCYEVDPPKRPRGFKNPAWAKKRGVRVNEHCDARNIEKERQSILDRGNNLYV